jgi:type IV pilus assembly protein PilV
MITTAARPNRRNGFTLLEVLIALLVMSIGLLGIGKLVMLSARANDSAYLRTQATALAYSIMDAMRANRDAALALNYNVALGINPGSVACNPCDATQQAQNDLAQWQGNVAGPGVLAQGVAGELPTGLGSVTTVTTLDATGATVTTATVYVQWNDQVAQQSFGGPAPPPTGSVTLETIL